MTKLIWGEVGSRIYEVGVEKGVFYPPGANGVAWNGLISVKEAPSSSGNDVRYIDGQKYHVPKASEGFAGTIEAITYPLEFEPYDGSDSRHWAHQQSRKPFGLSYQTLTRNDLDETFYDVHLVYNVLVEPTDRNYRTVGETLDPTIFSWDFTTLPEEVPNAKPSSHLVLKGFRSNDKVLRGLEEVLHGTDTTQPRLPLPSEVLQIVDESAVIRIIDHGDGTWTAIGPDDLVKMLDATTFEITSPTAVFLTDDLYQISSY